MWSRHRYCLYSSLDNRRRSSDPWPHQTKVLLVWKLIWLVADLALSQIFRLSDLKVWYIVLAIVIAVIIVVNLIIGFATTGKSTGRKASQWRTCGCSRSSTTTCLIKTVFVFNYLLFYFLVVLTIVVLLILFICYVLTSLCNEGTHLIVNPQNPEWPYPTDTRPGQSTQYLDLRQFSPLLALRSNETQFLYFKDDRLKKLCGDYVSALMFHIILCSIGMGLLSLAFLNFLITLSVNWVRISAKQKYAEIMYLNGAEMTAFNEGTDHAARYWPLGPFLTHDLWPLGQWHHWHHTHSHTAGI